MKGPKSLLDFAATGDPGTGPLKQTLPLPALCPLDNSKFNRPGPTPNKAVVGIVCCGTQVAR